mmetsp:Transcript_13884/g.26885  ORF Transcript_13884/g.26885 Transcript_13884/m.26885 type:complete len:82 (+) Transcript_13884:574-819(+)
MGFSKTRSVKVIFGLWQSQQGLSLYPSLTWSSTNSCLPYLIICLPLLLIQHHRAVPDLAKLFAFREEACKETCSTDFLPSG